MIRAEDEYSAVIARATDDYTRVVNAAFERKERAVRDSGSLVETFPYRKRDREREREHRRHSRYYIRDGSRVTI